jgi:hypothetical protein
MVTSLQLSIRATSVPAIGVNSPTMRRIAAAARRTDKIAMGMAGLLSRAEPALLTKASPTQQKWNTSVAMDAPLVYTFIFVYFPKE